MKKIILTYLVGIFLVSSALAGAAFFLSPRSGETLVGDIAAVTVRGSGVDSLILLVGKKQFVQTLRADGKADFMNVHLPKGPVVMKLLARMDGGWRQTDSVMVYVPGKLASIELSATPSEFYADGRSRGTLHIKLTDKWGRLITSPVVVTFGIDKGTFTGEDNNRYVPGFQQLISSGEGDIEFVVGNDAGELFITASVDVLSENLRLPLYTSYRPMIAVGYVGGELGYHSASASPEGVELDKEYREGILYDGRGAFFLQGGVDDRFLLTVSYDSKVNKRPILFRKTDPEELLPIYGDTGDLFYVARSTSPLYARIERNGSYIMWGDFSTSLDPQGEFAAFNRTLTGLSGKLDTKYVNGGMFFSPFTNGVNTRLRRDIHDIIQGDGTSGFYDLSEHPIVRGSEQVRIEVHSRYESDVILSSEPKDRFSDYEMDYTDGRLLMKEPVLSHDGDLNPIYIVVDYEVEGEPEEAYVGGARIEAGHPDYFTVGLTGVGQHTDSTTYSVVSADATAHYKNIIRLRGEIGQSQLDSSALAYKVELQGGYAGARGSAYYRKIEGGFINPSSTSIIAGQEKIGGTATFSYKDFGVKGEGFHESLDSGLKRDRATMELSQRYKSLKLTGGGEFWRSDSVSSFVAKGRFDWQALKRLNFYLRRWQKVSGDMEYPTSTALGTEIKLLQNHTLFGAIEQLESDSTTRRVGSVGVRSSIYGIQTRGEMKMSQGGDGFNSQAIIGISDRINIAKWAYLDIAFENNEAVQGDSSGDFYAYSTGITLKPVGWLITSKYEFRRHNSEGDKILGIAGASTNLGQSFSLLFKDRLEVQKNRGDNLEDYHIARNKAMLGFALRPHTTDWINILGKVEHRLDFNRTVEPWVYDNTIYGSVHSIVSFGRAFELTTRYAARTNWQVLEIWVDEEGRVRIKQHSSLTDLYLGRLRLELSTRFDIALEGRYLTQHRVKDHRYGCATEIGIVPYTNIRLALGYNWLGYQDDIFAEGSYWARGPYISLGLKLSERGLGIPLAN